MVNFYGDRIMFDSFFWHFRLLIQRRRNKLYVAPNKEKRKTISKNEEKKTKQNKMLDQFFNYNVDG